MATIESTEERTESKWIAAEVLVCPNGCAPDTEWTFHQTESVDVAYRVEYSQFGTKILRLVEVGDERYVEDGEERYVCDGCDFELPRKQLRFLGLDSAPTISQLGTDSLVVRPEAPAVLHANIR